MRLQSLTQTRFARLRTTPRWSVRLVLLLALFACLNGCATGRYTAKNLPDAWRAQPMPNVQTVELAKLASPTSQTDLIARGDVLEVSLSSGLPSERISPRAVRVDDGGAIFLAELGRVSVEGFELETAEATIATQCVERDLYRTPQVTVTMKQPKVNRVTVVGAVKKPSTYLLRSGQSNLLAALVAADGLADDAGTSVEIRHPGFRDGRSAPKIASRGGASSSGIELAGYEESLNGTVQTTSGSSHVMRVDLVSATENPTGGYELADGAVVNVERHDPDPIHVFGLVRKPDEYKFPVGKPVRITAAIAKAGDLSNPLANKIYVIRNVEGQPDPIVIEVSLKRAKERGAVENIVLMPGDTVSVEKTPATILYDAIRLVSFGVGGSVF